jgi:hypothetical protein
VGLGRGLGPGLGLGFVLGLGLGLGIAYPYIALAHAGRSREHPSRICHKPDVPLSVRHLGQKERPDGSQVLHLTAAMHH